MPIITLPAGSLERSRLIPSDFIRRRALERLYERKAAVEDLIESLETYERITRPKTGECVPFRAEPKCSSSFAQ
jgi:hypothetical protein